MRKNCRITHSESRKTYQVTGQPSAVPQGNLSSQFRFAFCWWENHFPGVLEFPHLMRHSEQKGGGNQETWSSLCPWLPPPASVFEAPRCDPQDFQKMWKKVVMSPLKVQWEGKGWTQHQWREIMERNESRHPNQEDLLLLFTFPCPHPTCFFHNSIIEKAL